MNTVDDPLDYASNVPIGSKVRVPSPLITDDGWEFCNTRLVTTRDLCASFVCPDHTFQSRSCPSSGALGLRRRRVCPPYYVSEKLVLYSRLLSWLIFCLSHQMCRLSWTARSTSYYKMRHLRKSFPPCVFGPASVAYAQAKQTLWLVSIFL